MKTISSKIRCNPSDLSVEQGTLVVELRPLGLWQERRNSVVVRHFQEMTQFLPLMNQLKIKQIRIKSFPLLKQPRTFVTSTGMDLTIKIMAVNVKIKPLLL